MEIRNIVFYKHTGYMQLLMVNKTTQDINLNHCLDHEYFYKDNKKYLWLRIKKDGSSFSDYEFDTTGFESVFYNIVDYLS